MYEAELFVTDGFANCSKTYPTSFSPGTSMALEEGGKRALRCSAFMQARECGLPSTELKCPHFDVAGGHLHGGMFRHLNARDHQCAVPSCNILYKSHFVQLLESVWRCLNNLYRYPNYWDSQVKVCCSSSTAVMFSGFWSFCFIWGYALCDPVATRRPEYSTWSIKWYVHRMEIFSACFRGKQSYCFLPSLVNFYVPALELEGSQWHLSDGGTWQNLEVSTFIPRQNLTLQQEPVCMRFPQLRIEKQSGYKNTRGNNCIYISYKFPEGKLLFQLFTSATSYHIWTFAILWRWGVARTVHHLHVHSYLDTKCRRLMHWYYWPAESS